MWTSLPSDPRQLRVGSRHSDIEEKAFNTEIREDFTEVTEMVLSNAVLCVLCAATPCPLC